jgi:hypothetical protein
VFKGIDKTNQEARDRGYYISDMEETKRKILSNRKAWKHEFTQFCHEITYDDSSLPTTLIIEKAEELTDSMFSKMELKFPEEIGEELDAQN